MRRKLFGHFAVVVGLALTVGVCRADMTYDVNLAIGGDTVTGTIVTDGTLGVLGSADIVSYALTFAGPEPGTDPNGPMNVNVTGNALSATASDLLFDFGASGFVYLSDVNNPIPRFVVCGSGYTQFCGGVGLSDGGSQFTGESGTQVIATAGTVPEPSSLLGIGIGVLALAGLRRRKLIHARS